ncbi:MAG: PTS glucose transporter subunit IIA [Coriobacteriaceae bacterium]|nr:PTS glucose transporter subunit IIA [Coriobacteriaceae bacterium]
MGLFDMFKKKEAPEAPVVPASIDAQDGADVLCSPVSGKAIKMADVPDPVFSGEVLGKGCAVWPEGEVVYAPVSGKVTVVMGHAVGIMSDSGVEVLVHVGVDTVNLQGKGFTGYVSQGDQVAAGQPILSMDRSVIAEAGYKDCVVVAVSNSAEFADVELAVENEGRVEAGSVVAKVTRK